MRVAYVCSEVFPLLKTGGLADVSAALPPALAALGMDVRMVLPGFSAIFGGFRQQGEAIALPHDGGPLTLRQTPGAARLLPGFIIDSGQPAYLVDAPTLYRRAGGPYQDAAGREWPDNAERFALLGWVAACLARGVDTAWQPQILHLHDWHAALAPAYLRAAQVDAASPVARCRSVITIHNLAYQGLFPYADLQRTGLPPWMFHIDALEFHGQVSFLKGGIVFADAITTVSPRYASEILTSEQGCGLDGLLRKRRDRLRGILNGVDYEVWNPSSDPQLELTYDAARIEKKASNRRALQRELGLQQRDDALLFASVSRLTEQKGLHLLPPLLDEMVQRGGQLVVFGSGDPHIERALQEAAAAHPGQARFVSGYDEGLAHRIIGGADVILVPSRFEPCGLTQLYGLRYGTLPLVHHVGGLADTVCDSSLENLDAGEATGFVFDRFDEDSIRAAMRRAFALRRRRDEWQAVQQRGMNLRFDWSSAARSYAELFESLVGSPRPPGRVPGAPDAPAAPDAARATHLPQDTERRSH